MKNDPGKKVFDILGFQYKPLEKKLLANLPEAQKVQYKKLSYARKIHVLDGIASQLGL